MSSAQNIGASIIPPPLPPAIAQLAGRTVRVLHASALCTTNIALKIAYIASLAFVLYAAYRLVRAAINHFRTPTWEQSKQHLLSHQTPTEQVSQLLEDITMGDSYANIIQTITAALRHNPRNSTLERLTKTLKHYCFWEESVNATLPPAMRNKIISALLDTTLHTLTNGQQVTFLDASLAYAAVLQAYHGKLCTALEDGGPLPELDAAFLQALEAIVTCLSSEPALFSIYTTEFAEVAVCRNSQIHTDSVTYPCPPLYKPSDTCERWMYVKDVMRTRKNVPFGYNEARWENITHVDYTSELPIEEFHADRILIFTAQDMTTLQFRVPLSMHNVTPQQLKEAFTFLADSSSPGTLSLQQQGLLTGFNSACNLALIQALAGIKGGRFHVPIAASTSPDHIAPSPEGSLVLTPANASETYSIPPQTVQAVTELLENVCKVSKVQLTCGTETLDIAIEPVTPTRTSIEYSYGTSTRRCLYLTNELPPNIATLIERDILLAKAQQLQELATSTL